MFSVNEKFSILLEDYRKKWGYDLTANDLIRLWLYGELQLTDSQEDTLIEFTEENNL